MRFTKIPLIATLMAVALSLLIVLPSMAQTNDRTDGKVGDGVIGVGVYDNIADAQAVKLVRSTFNFGVNPPPEDKHPYIPTTSTDSVAVTSGTIAKNDASYLADRRTDSQNTLFRGTLYVSNMASAYDTVLINVAAGYQNSNNQWVTCKDDITSTTALDESRDAGVTATVKNNRSGKSITIELVATVDGNGTHSLDPNDTTDVQGADAGDYSQGLFKVVPDDGENEESNGPNFCTDSLKDTDDSTAGIQPETEVDNATDATIAQIPARHGDRLTITTSGGSGQIPLTVDGEGPEFSAVTPDDNTVTRKSRLGFNFEVRDDDSGLRHDGEGVITPDGDYKEVNADGDQQIHGEPLSVSVSQTISGLNGPAADIDVNVALNKMNGTNDSDDYKDISATGAWRMAGNRAGVAYSFSASGGYGDGNYLYQLEATDRAGNTSMTDALSDTDAKDPFVFEVDDAAPDPGTARTGIGYDTAKNKEKVDRSYIAIDFGVDALGDVNTSSITVAGHDVVGVVHPSKAPRINRGEDVFDTKPTSVDKPEGSRPSATEPTTAAPTNNGGWDNMFIANASGTETLAGTILGRQANLPDSCQPTGGFGTPLNLNEIVIPSTDTDNCALWKSWMVYEDNLGKQRTWDTENTDYNQYVKDLAQWEAENPGRDIEGGLIPEPRARIYVQLAEPLAADATPSVVVLGGAALDLAGNSNNSETLSKGNGKVEDWIAPTLTVTVNGTADDRPVANAKGAFKVDVTSDEDLRRRPKVYFVEITSAEDTKGTTTTTDDVWNYTITSDDSSDGSNTGNDNVDEMQSLTLQETENHWAKSYKVSSIETHFDGLFGVVVVGQDNEDNIGATAGWSAHGHREGTTATTDARPNEGDALVLSKMDTAKLLAEIDKVFNNGSTSDIGTVTPRSDADGKVTESANPFVKLEFDSEKDEYKNGEFKDSHDTVEVTEITLDGENAMANLNRVSATQFSLITRDLAVGKYKVEYTAEDDAGTEYEGEFEFTVNERQPYEVDVQPGWNLVSLPATPVEPAVGDVLSGNDYITPVLGYQQGDWVTAVQEEDGTWRGRLEEIVGGYGYWVHARTFSTIETMLAEVDPAATLPTVPVTAGWNLLGVLDIYQNDAEKSPGSDANDDEADDYFSSIPWKVAYTYDTTRSLWEKTTPGDHSTGTADGNEIFNGKGYWVWSPNPSTLVP